LYKRRNMINTQLLFETIQNVSKISDLYSTILKETRITKKFTKSGNNNSLKNS